MKKNILYAQTKTKQNNKTVIPDWIIIIIAARSVRSISTPTPPPHLHDGVEKKKKIQVLK